MSIDFGRKRNIKRFVVIGFILCLLLLIAFEYWRISFPPLTTPIWHVHDWFEIDKSVRNPSRNQGWTNKERLHFTVSAEKSFQGVPCYEVILTSTTDMGETPETFHSPIQKICTIDQYGHITHITDLNSSLYIPITVKDSDKYYFRKSDLTLLAINNKYGIVPLSSAPGDYTKMFNFVPMFPVRGGATHIGSDDTRHAYRESVHLNQRNLTTIRIDQNRYTCRWVPGQMWWVQCWDNPWYYTDYHTSSFRAALVATSQNGILNYQLPRANYRGKILEPSHQINTTVAILLSLLNLDHLRR